MDYSTAKLVTSMRTMFLLRQWLFIVFVYSQTLISDINGQMCNELFTYYLYLTESNKLTCVYFDFQEKYTQTEAVAQCHDQLNSRMLYRAEEITAIV